ncbi:MAG TPA: hypothetical protein VF659_04040 [Pyrinomonadaceae bacterium]|jgi:hypothetical protein
MPRTLPLLTLLALSLLAQAHAAHAQVKKRAGAARERLVASRFAPVFRQALGDHPRADYITNFDFDGDWRGDNNWAHADDRRHRLRAYVYFAVSETATHFFAHYAVFHPRDYKGGSTAGPLLSDAIREGVRRGGRYDPTGLSREAVLAHENDMEGCLVVAAKDGDEPALARVVLVETLAHDRVLKYAPEGAPAPASFGRVRLEGQRPLLYVEPKGHGVYAYDGGGKQSPGRGTLVYKFEGRADDPEAGTRRDELGYELLPLFDTLWPRARAGAKETFGEVADYGAFSFASAPAGKRARRTTRKMGRLGAAFLGGFGARNAARPPWGWFDRGEPGQPPGAWFFDPAATARRHLGRGEDFSTTYLHAPFLGVSRP